MIQFPHPTRRLGRPRPGRRCCICCEGAAGRQTVAMRPRRSRAALLTRSAFAGFCFPSDVIVLAVRWYLRFGLSYRDVEELLADRGVEVDHTTIYCWVQRFTPLLVDAARPCRHAVGDRWQADESYARSPVGGATSTVRSTSSAKSSTCSSPHSATPRQPAASSSGPSAPPRSRPWRSSPTRRRPTRSRWTNCSRRRGIAPTAALLHLAVSAFDGLHWDICAQADGRRDDSFGLFYSSLHGQRLHFATLRRALWPDATVPRRADDGVSLAFLPCGRRRLG